MVISFLQWSVSVYINQTTKQANTKQIPLFFSVCVYEMPQPTLQLVWLRAYKAPPLTTEGELGFFHSPTPQYI